MITIGDMKSIMRAAEEAKMDSRRASWPQVDALLAADWKFELPAIHDIEPWQWQWRAPAKRKGSKGRLYPSTNQAYRALKKTKL